MHPLDSSTHINQALQESGIAIKEAYVSNVDIVRDFLPPALLHSLFGITVFTVNS